MWPAHEVLKKLGNAGLLGVNKPVEYGGLGLDWKYNLAVLGSFLRSLSSGLGNLGLLKIPNFLPSETAGSIRSSGVSMGIGVHTDMATPALAQYGSDELKRNFLAPAIAGDGLFCLGGWAQCL